RRLEVVVEPALQAQRLASRSGPDKAESFVFLDQSAEIGREVGLRSPRQPDAEMTICTQRAEYIGAYDTAADIDADIAVGELERSGEVRNFQIRLPGTSAPDLPTG